MGNRAVITFDKNPNPQSVGIYLHWNGGPESVLAFLEAADKLKVRDSSDPQYELARVVQIIANYFGGTNSIGVGALKTLDCDNGDNGTYRVNREKGTITIEQCDGNQPFAWRKLELDEIRKHPYWHPEPGKQSILDSVLERNAAHFAEKD